MVIFLIGLSKMYKPSSKSWLGGERRNPSDSTGIILNGSVGDGSLLKVMQSKTAFTSSSERRRAVAISIVGVFYDERGK